MEKITTEALLTTMFKYGFEQIDPLLYTFTLAKVSYQYAKNKYFELAYDEPLSDRFKYHTVKVGPVYKMNMSANQRDIDRWLSYHSNDRLLECLNSINFGEIIEKKREALGLEINELIKNPIFSQREKDIIINHNNPVIKQLKEKEDMKKNTDYIDWLVKFTQNETSFEDHDIINSEEIDNYDKSMVKKLSTFFGIIVEYADNNNIIEKSIDDGYCYYLKYKDTILEIGLYQGQGVTNYSAIAPNKYNNTAINYEDIINYYSDDKPKTYKKQ